MVAFAVVIHLQCLVSVYLSLVKIKYSVCVKKKKKKMWHIYTREYYSAIKRNEIELFVVRWMDLESVIQSEVRKLSLIHI